MEAANHIWNAIARYSLSQTCRMLRKEFDPMHRYHIMVKGVPKYILELENYDVDRMGRLRDLITLEGPLLEQLRTKLTAEKFVIVILANGCRGTCNLLAEFQAQLTTYHAGRVRGCEGDVWISLGGNNIAVLQ